MKRILVALALASTAAPLAAQRPDYEQMAVQSFMTDDYVTARKNLELALQNETDPAKQLEIRRKIAVVNIFDGELSEARDIYEDIIDAMAAARLPKQAHDHYALATIGALQHKKYDVQKHLLHGDSVLPHTPYAPMLHAIVWAHVGELERTAKAKADMEAAAAEHPQDSIARQAAALTRAIYATKIRAFDVARAEMSSITSPSLSAFATAFLANATRREGKRVEAAEMDKEVRKYKELTIYSAIANRLIK
jgi:hypothetical protein